MSRKSTEKGGYAQPDGDRERALASGSHAADCRLGRSVHPLHRAEGDDNEKDKEKWIGEHLRKAYDDVLKEPVPDHLARLLRELEEKERSSK